MAKTTGLFKVLKVHSYIVAIEENGISITASQGRISVSPLVYEDERVPKPEKNAQRLPEEDAVATLETNPPLESDTNPVEMLVSHRRLRSVYKNRVRWFGYAPKDDKWLYESEIPDHFII